MSYGYDIVWRLHCGIDLATNDITNSYGIAMSLRKVDKENHDAILPPGWLYRMYMRYKFIRRGNVSYSMRPVYEIRESNIKKGCIGLFACRTYYKGESLAFYIGRKLGLDGDVTTTIKDGTMLRIFDENFKECILYAPKISAFELNTRKMFMGVQYIVDPNNVIGSNENSFSTRVKENCQTNVKFEKDGLCRCIRRIAKGDEILVNWL
jgi:hypothetical protein